MKRGEIWWASLPEPTGSEPGYRRPVLVIQSDEFNRSNIRTVLCAALTSNLDLVAAPGNVLLSTAACGLSRRSVVNVSQLITLDRSLLSDRVKMLGPAWMSQVDDGLRLVTGL